MLSLMLAIDLVLTLRNPFVTPNQRAKWYYLCSVVVSLSCTLVVKSVQYDPKSVVAITVTIFIKSLFFVIVVPSLLHTLQFMTKPGLSKEYRTLVMRRQAIYVILVSVIQVVSTVSYLQTISWINEPLWLQYTCAYLFALVAVFMSTIRLSEPNVYN